MNPNENEVAMQSALFDLPKRPTPTCPHGGQPTGLRGYPTGCPTCNHEAVARFLRWYASHGASGGKKRPGMAFPSGRTTPTPEDRASAHQLLDDLGFPV